MAKTFFKKADADNSGGIDKTELKTMLANGAGSNTSKMKVDDIFVEADTNGDGSIDETENTTQMKKMGGKGAPPVGGKPPSGGSPPSGAGQTAGTSSSASNEVYDEKDANEDGTVSAQEKLAYYISHPQDSESQSGAQKTSGYDQAGKQNTGSGVANSLVNITA
jgi:hypothetical protein